MHVLALLSWASCFPGAVWGAFPQPVASPVLPVTDRDISQAQSAPLPGTFSCCLSLLLIGFSSSPVRAAHTSPVLQTNTRLLDPAFSSLLDPPFSSRVHGALAPLCPLILHPSLHALPKATGCLLGAESTDACQSSVCVSSFSFDCGHSHLEVFLPSLQGPRLLLHICLLTLPCVLGFPPCGCPVPWVLPRLALPAPRVQVHASGWPLSFALESAYSSAPWKSLLGSSIHLKDVISRRAHLPHPAFLRCAPVSLLIEGTILHLVSQVGI